MRASLFALPLIIAACNPIAELEDPVPRDLRKAPYPDLAPTDSFTPLPAPKTSLETQRDGLAARAADLQSRAQGLGGTIDEATRQRLEQGVTDG